MSLWVGGGWVGMVGAVATIVGKCGGPRIGTRIRYLILDKQKHVGFVGWWWVAWWLSLMLFAALVGCMLQHWMVRPPAHQAIVRSALLLIVLHNRLFRCLLAPYQLCMDVRVVPLGP